MDGRHQVFHNSNISETPETVVPRPPPASDAATRLPTYMLYGEADARPATDWLHWESIAERSRRHNWEIQAHRHASLFQILYIRRGAGRATVDGQAWRLRGPCVLSVPALVPQFDLYFSFTSGPSLKRLEREFGARRAVALHCMVDPDLYRPLEMPVEFDLGYLGTYSADRQPALERLLLAPARQLPTLRFVVAGAQYPRHIEWPRNVDRLEHVAPVDSGVRATLRGLPDALRAPTALPRRPRGRFRRARLVPAEEDSAVDAAAADSVCLTVPTRRRSAGCWGQR